METKVENGERPEGTLEGFLAHLGSFGGDLLQMTVGEMDREAIARTYKSVDKKRKAITNEIAKRERPRRMLEQRRENMQRLHKAMLQYMEESKPNLELVVVVEYFRLRIADISTRIHDLMPKELIAQRHQLNAWCKTIEEWEKISQAFLERIDGIRLSRPGSQLPVPGEGGDSSDGKRGGHHSGVNRADLANPVG